MYEDGAFGWNGGFGTSWLVDPARGLIVIVLTQRLFESAELPRVHREIQAAAYARSSGSERVPSAGCPISTALRSVAAIRYVTPLREGGSLPGLVEADDDGLYVVKFRGRRPGAAGARGRGDRR